MKIILSRKGFDSTAGGYPSPIIDGCELVSFPIPENMDKVYDSYKSVYGSSYNNHVTQKGISYNVLLNLLLHQRNPKLVLEEKRIDIDKANCHYDPQILSKATQVITPKYTGLFGQSGNALAHLKNEGVDVGDIFLFYGWFRDTTYTPERGYRYIANTDKHIIWGWFEIGGCRNANNVIDADDISLRQHPHSFNKDKSTGNIIYLASDKLTMLPDLPGAGVFKYHKKLVLTKDGMSRSKWDLPSFFKGNVSCHNADCFKNDYFQSRGRGQEFVLDANKGVLQWAEEILKTAL
ncbi:MAG: hypothetical protein PHX16_09265 [Syntrophaceticus sp.]|nr:hypothetical protein [Syntrophaceticus sp.]